MVDSATLGVITNLATGAAIFLAALVLYDVLRFFFPGQFFYREAAAADPAAAHYDGTPLVALPRPSRKPLAWIPFTTTYPEHALIRTHGLDVALYLRFLATQVKVFAILTVFTALVLYPTYITADNRNRPADDPVRPVGIEIASLSNVPDKSNRLWVTLLCEIVVVAVILLLLYRDILKYTIYRRNYRSLATNPANYALIVLDIPKPFRTRHQVYQVFHSAFPAQVDHVYLVRDAEKLAALKAKYLAALTKRERAEYEAALRLAPDAHPAHPSPTAHSKPETRRRRRQTADTDRIAACQAREHELERQIEEKERNLDDIAPLTHAAIVVFRSKRVATLAATAPIWTASDAWRCSRAAEPRAVNWNRLDITHKTERIRQYISFVCLTAMAVLWTFPASFIQALGSFEELAKQWPNSFFADWQRNSPGFVRFLEGVLPPLLQFLLLLLVPFVFRFMVSFERIHSRVLVEAKVRNYLFFFYFMANFIYVVVIGSVFTKFQSILENPNNLVSLLSTSVPAQATFLMKYVLINAFLGSTLGMLNIGRLLVRPFLMMRAKTPREVRKSNGIFAQYPFAKTYALCANVALISYVYTTIAPVINAVALLYFCIAYLCTKQLLMYSHRGQFEGGGFLFRDAWTGALFGLYVHQLSMIGIFSLKRATPQAILAIISLVFSIWFNRYCRNKFFFRAKHGSIIDQLNADEEAGLQDEIPESFPDLYRHPGLTTLEDLVSTGEDDEASISKEDESFG